MAVSISDLMRRFAETRDMDPKAKLPPPVEGLIPIFKGEDTQKTPEKVSFEKLIQDKIESSNFVKKRDCADNENLPTLAKEGQQKLADEPLTVETLKGRRWFGLF